MPQLSPMVVAIIFGVYLFSIIILLQYLFAGRKDRLPARLKEIEDMGGQVREKKKEEKSPGSDKNKRFKASERISNDIKGAGIALKPEEYLALWASVTLLPAVAVYIAVGSLLTFFIVGAVGFCIPPIWISQAKKKRLNLFTTQLGDALMTIGNCLRSGFTFRQSMERVVSDMPEPISGEFKIAVTELNYGASMERAMETMAQRMKNHELELVCSALIVQQRVGGNLADIIDNVAKTIKDRIKIKRSVKTLTAQGRMSGLIIGLIPVILFVVINMLNPGYMVPLFSSKEGHIMIIVSVLLEATGFYCIQKLVNLKF